MKKRLLFLSDVFLLVAAATYGQTASAAKDHAPLPVVSVLVKATTTGTATVLSFIGYAIREIPVEARMVIDVLLEEDISHLDLGLVWDRTTRKGCPYF